MNDTRALFVDLYDQHYERLFNIVFTLSSRDEPLSKDLIQDFFLKLWKQMEAGQTTWDCFEAWSYTVVRNLWLDHCCSYDTKHVSKHGDDLDDVRKGRETSDLESNQEFEAVAVVEKAIGECTFDLAIHRAILRLLPTLHVPFDSPDADIAIAHELNKSPSYIKTQRPKAINALKQCLRAKGIRLTDLS